MMATQAQRIASLEARVNALDRQYQSNWISSPTDGGWSVQEFAPGRATLVAGRDGRKAVRLHTEPGDAVYGTNIDRCDLQGDAATNVHEGQEDWWAHSVKFPLDYVDLPPSNGVWNWGVAFDFHDDANIVGSQGPAQLLAMPPTAISPDRPVGLHYQIYGGDPANPSVRNYPIVPIAKSLWYDFVYHIRWSSNSSGFYDGWLNGTRFMAHKGPTLWNGRGAYMKLANYHNTFGKPSSIHHERVIRGRTWQSVSLTPLEGMA